MGPSSLETDKDCFAAKRFPDIRRIPEKGFSKRDGHRSPHRVLLEITILTANYPCPNYPPSIFHWHMNRVVYQQDSYNFHSSNWFEMEGGGGSKGIHVFEKFDRDIGRNIKGPFPSLWITKGRKKRRDKFMRIRLSTLLTKSILFLFSSSSFSSFIEKLLFIYIPRVYTS